MMKSEIAKPDTFLYFTYNSNMFTFRMHMLNPKAEFVTIGRVDNYRLDFIRYSSFWGGPTATLVPTANAHTWGVIWRMNKCDIPQLDETEFMARLRMQPPTSAGKDSFTNFYVRQEGVNVKKYYAKDVQVHTTHMGDFTCRTYIQRLNPLPRGDNDDIPVERWPSWALKEIMVYGAKEHGLPNCYIKYLRRLKHNGEEGAIRTWWLLDRYGRDKPCECRVPGRIPREPLKFDNKYKKRWPSVEIIEE